MTEADTGDEWLPIATHGDPPHKVRAALERLDLKALNALRRDMAAQGFTEREIKFASAKYEQMLSERLDAMLPNIMRNMAETAARQGEESG